MIFSIMNFAKAMKVARLNCDLKVREAAKKIGCSQSNLSDIENGRVKSPSFEIVAKATKVYKIDINELVELIDC